MMQSVTEGVTRFSQLAVPILEERNEAGTETVTIEQLDDRYQNYCGPCPEFGGVICNQVGCSTKKWCVNKYFNILLTPSMACPYLKTGFPKV